MSRRATRGRRRSRGQGLVEFALAAPVALLVIIGLISGDYLFYHDISLRDGASAGARMATIETPLVHPVGAQYCESGQPAGTVVGAVTAAMPNVAVNQAPLCAASPTATQLSQTATSPGWVSIVVSAWPDVSAPTTLTVTLSLSESGLAPPLSGTYTMNASSTLPVEVP
jgi:Flp pilus assembly protein TadG